MKTRSKMSNIQNIIILSSIIFNKNGKRYESWAISRSLDPLALEIRASRTLNDDMQILEQTSRRGDVATCRRRDVETSRRGDVATWRRRDVAVSSVFAPLCPKNCFRSFSLCSSEPVITPDTKLGIYLQKQ